MLKNKNNWFAFALVSGLLITACSHQISQKVPATPAPMAQAINNAIIQKSPNDDRTYAALLLPNQLQVVLVSDPTLENSAASLAVGVGSAQDPESQPGLAHYLEHMLFLGTKKFPEPDNFFSFVETNAGQTNAFTDFDNTNFHFQINAAKFDEALERYSDYFKSPLLDPHFADKERHAVDSEWSMDKSQDAWILHALDGLTANPENPRAHFSIGNLETLVDKKDSKLQAELKSFYDRYYSANNMRLTLVGKQSIDELKALAQKYFSDIPDKHVVRPKVSVPGITRAQMAKEIHYQPRKDLKQLLIDFPIKSTQDQWKVKPEAFVLNLLGSEEEGTLCESLRKAGLANNVMASVSSDEYGEDGFIRIQVDLTEKGLQNPDQIIASTFAYVDLVKKQGLKERYFRELQAMRAKDFANMSKPDPLTQAITITTNQFDFPVENLLNHDAIYDHYDAAAISAVMEELKPENARIWYINKNEKADREIPHFDGRYSVSDITAQDFARWAQLANNLHFNLPPENNLFTDKPAEIVPNEFLKPHQVVSEKGVEAFLTNPEFYREDKGVLEVELNVDFAKKTPKNQVLANLLNSLVKLKETTLLDRAERASLGVEVRLSATGSQYYAISGYTTKHQELLQMLLKDFSALQVSQSDFDGVLDKYKRDIANNKKAIPLRQGFNNMRRLLSATHWTDEQLLAAANKLSLQDLQAYHAAVKANPLLRIYAFGNYTAADIDQIAQSAAKVLPGKKLPAQRRVETFITPKAGQTLVFRDKVEQADNAVIEGVWGDKKSDDEQAQLVVINAFFSNAFFRQLRTNEQLGYIVGSTHFAMDDFPGFALYVQTTNTEVPALKARIDNFRKEFFEDIKALDPPAIWQFKKSEEASVLQKPTDFYKEAKLYEGDFWAGHYDFNARDRYIASLRKVDKEGLINTYKKYLLDGKGLNLVIEMQTDHLAPQAPSQPAAE